MMRAAVALALLLLAGPAIAAPTPAPSTAAMAPSRIRLIRISPAALAEENILGDLMVGLTTLDTAARPIPGMAESWTVSPDGKLWTFHLRHALWSDGTPSPPAILFSPFAACSIPKPPRAWPLICGCCKTRKASAAASCRRTNWVAEQGDLLALFL